MAKKKTLKEMEVPGLEYYIVILHRKGRIPQVLEDRNHDGPAIFDSEAEASAIGRLTVRSEKMTGWKFTACKLRD